MARTGRPPKPTHLKLLAGNPGKRKVNRREPRPKAGRVTPPSWLGKLAKQEWRRVLAAMPAELYTKADRQALAQYCQNTARIRELEGIVTDLGYTCTTDKGYVMQRPEFAMLKNLQQVQIRLMTELGLTPSSRSRIQMPEAPKEDPIDALLFGKRQRPAAG